MSKKISLQELSKHNTLDNGWVAIHDNVYNVTNFVDHHPGGKHLFAQAVGKDITCFFESSHVFSTASNLLGSAKVPLVGQLIVNEGENPQPKYVWPSPLYQDIKDKVIKLIKDRQENPRLLDMKRFLNYCFIMLSLMTFTHLTFYSSFDFGIRAVCAVMTSLFVHLFMTHIAHDQGHTAFSSNHHFWYYVAYINDFMVGLSRLIWVYRHNLGHHCYTNVKLADPDISYYHDLEQENIFYKAPLKLELPTYIRPLLYAVGTFLMKCEDIVAMLRGKFGIVTINPLSTVEFVHFWTAKFWFVFYRLLLPMYLGKGVIQTLALFFIIEAVSGLVFTLFSQLNHVNTDCDWQPKEEDKDWAITQVRTSVDYCHDSFLWTYLSGYLNHQIAHHLFPTLNPGLYPQISQICMQACKEHNVKMIVKPTFAKAVMDHFDQLDYLAKQA